MPLPEPIKWDSKIILLKPEGANHGVDSAPTGALNAMLLKEVEFRPMEGQDVNRNLEKAFQGADEEFPTGIYCMMTGVFEAVGSGQLGVAPAWGPMLRLCGVSETITPDTVPGDGKVEYEPVTEGQESASVHFWIGTTRHIMLYTKATAVATFTAQGLPGFRVTMTGLFVTPSNQARVVPDLSKFQVPEVATKANTMGLEIGGLPFVVREFSFDLGCTVSPRLLIGRESVIIESKKEVISAQVEAQPLNIFNPFEEAITRARRTVKFEHGSSDGRRITFEAPVTTMGRLTGYANQQNVTEWPLKMTPLPTLGDDQWKITLT